MLHPSGEKAANVRPEIPQQSSPLSRSHILIMLNVWLASLRGLVGEKQTPSAQTEIV
jgi:hypothetical protein